MPFEMWGFNFEGTFASPEYLKSIPGVYVVWCKSQEGLTVIDVGESENVKDSVQNHDRINSWLLNCKEEIHYSAAYTPKLNKERRKAIEQDIKNSVNIICGDY